MSKKDYKAISDELWEGIEYLRDEYRLRDTEENFHTFDLESYGYSDDKSPQEMKRDVRIFMKRWTALKDRTFTKVAESWGSDAESEMYDFYFDPPYEDPDDIEENVLEIYGEEL